MTTPKYLDPVRSINSELLHRLEMVSDHVSPLPGGSARRVGGVDPRLNIQGPLGDTVTYYEHIATVREAGTGIYLCSIQGNSRRLVRAIAGSDQVP